jgi:hypothetical protein
LGSVDIRQSAEIQLWFRFYHYYFKNHTLSAFYR